MKIAILSCQGNSFQPIMAEGLQRMLDSVDVEAKIFTRGLSLITNFANHNSKISKSSLKNFLFHKIYAILLIEKLKKFDALIIISPVPTAFLNNFINDEVIRNLLKDIPIILYSNYYLYTVGGGIWLKSLKQGNAKRGILGSNHYGLERYDYYLSTSIITEKPLTTENHPYARIGINLDDRTLFPDQKEFIALIDFERERYTEERKIQIEVLEETNTQYIILNGSYSRQEIREIYRKCSLYFLAHRESFGLPICELQACGSYVFSPYHNWCPGHWLKEDITQQDQGKFSPNFIVYDNNKEKLIQKINEIKSNLNPTQVREQFLKYHPHFFYGDIEEIKKFVKLLKEGKINSQSHLQYNELNDLKTFYDIGE